jgi:hypothetical protein
MLVKFRTNLGINDAKELKVNWKECTRDSVVDVPQEAGLLLVKRNIAEPADVKGVAKKPEVTAPDNSVAGLREKFEDATPEEFKRKPAK